ncbi:MAG: outer membrane protein [Xanthobacteraceae bacterium]|jgi:outer membrane immunogenic protein
MRRLGPDLVVGIAVAASVLATTARAADLPPPAAPPPRAPVAYIPAAPAFSWTGFYIGLNAGYAFGQSNWTSPMGSTGWFDVNGPLAGGTIGGNYQIGQIVVGAESDFDWQNVKGTLIGGNCTLPGAVPASCRSASNWLGTFRARIGFAMDRVLLYATGGGAVANIKASLNTLPWASSTELGWASGLGIEVAMTDNWTAKAEYLAVGFQQPSCGLANCFAAPPVSVKFYESMVRGGVNYKF